MPTPALDPACRKRKSPDSIPADNERLSKRMSRLKIAFPHRYSATPPLNLGANTTSEITAAPPATSSYLQPIYSHPQSPAISQPDGMLLDDTSFTTYIHNLDDELSSSDSDSADADPHRLEFLSDLHKRFGSAAAAAAVASFRIPRPVPLNTDTSADGMQMVLYSEPTSLTVPEERDSVRRAVAEARERLRERQREKEEEGQLSAQDDPDAMDLS